MDVKSLKRLQRHRRVRKKVSGTLKRPRLSLHRSHLNLYAQLMDDLQGKVLLSCSTRDPEFRKIYPKGGDCGAAKHLGVLLAEKALKNGITQVVFDRNGYLYHGRVKALADAARDKGLTF